jgi:phasin family protein
MWLSVCSNSHTHPNLDEGTMLKGFEEFQKAGKDGFDAYVRSFGEMNKGFQAIAAEVTEYSKKAFEDSTRAFEQLAGAKSIEQAIEIQSQFAKKAYDTYMAEMSKLGEMYVGMAKDAYKPVESAFTKKVS